MKEVTSHFLDFGQLIVTLIPHILRVEGDCDINFRRFDERINAKHNRLHKPMCWFDEMIADSRGRTEAHEKIDVGYTRRFGSSSFTTCRRCW